MKKYKLLVFICGIIIICTACKNDYGKNSEESKETEKTGTTNKEDELLNYENLIMTIMCNYPENDTGNIYYFLAIMNDGSVYSMKYSLNESGSDNNNFLKKLYTCDDSVWSLFDNVELLGKLSDEKVYLINENIMKVNLDSDYYDRKSEDFGIEPEDIEIIQYNAWCYPLMSEGNKKAFHVKTWGVARGCSYETYDEMSVTILEAIMEDEILKQWDIIMEDEIYKLQNAGYITKEIIKNR